MFGFGKDAWAQARQLFADQFESDGENFIYRKSLKGPPIRVTSAERETYIDRFNRSLRYSSWGVGLGTLVVLASAVWMSVQSGSDPSDAYVYIGLGALVAVYLVYYFWAWGAPARELARRPALGDARSRAEVRRLMFLRLSYGKLATAAFGGIFLVFSISGRQDVFSGWGRLWLLFAGGLIPLAGIQAFRKWRFEKQDLKAATPHA
jgi:hypothetical protein